jgi:hypothetical protein
MQKTTKFRQKIQPNVSEIALEIELKGESVILVKKGKKMLFRAQFNASLIFSNQLDLKM